MVDERPQTWESALARGAGYLLLGLGLLVGGVVLISERRTGLVFPILGVPSLIAGLALLATARTAESVRTYRGLAAISLTIAMLMPTLLAGGIAAGLRWNGGAWLMMCVPLFFLGLTGLAVDLIGTLKRRKA